MSVSCWHPRGPRPKAQRGSGIVDLPLSRSGPLRLQARKPEESRPQRVLEHSRWRALLHAGVILPIAPTAFLIPVGKMKSQSSRLRQSSRSTPARWYRAPRVDNQNAKWGVSLRGRHTAQNDGTSPHKAGRSGGLLAPVHAAHSAATARRLGHDRYQESSSPDSRTSTNPIHHQPLCTPTPPAALPMHPQCGRSRPAQQRGKW